ncbi:diacylglycerol/lipid kinase family protein [Weissella fangxianensis]|uniref:diacylglycerol/lipid kinase family protein n=1 Tax=Weissella fangxianensis TaxID=2953879 RepID=UPI00215856FF|nr:diacylglycerol kinase family protein [Weissella fangxianensis]
MAYSFFINPIAGNGVAKQKWRKLQRYLNEQSIAYRVFYSDGPGAVEDQISQSIYDQASVIIIGGDGTLHEALNGLLKNETPNQAMPIAYISAGSGNDFARSHQLSDDPIQAFKRINHQIDQNNTTLLDIGKCLDEQTSEVTYFVNNLGIGIDATTVAFANQSKIKRWLNRYHIGGFSYFLAIFQSLKQQDAFDAEVMLQDQKESYCTNNAFLITVSNQPYFGGGIKILPGASSVDGLFDIILVDHPKSLGRLIWLIGALLRGNHYRYSEVHHLKSARIGLKSETKEYSHLDGEVISAKKSDLRLSTIKYPFYI